MNGMDEFKEKAKLTHLSVEQFLEHTNQERPNITGGCILLTNATLVCAMVLMALKITIKKSSDPKVKRFLKGQAAAINLIQAQLSAAATKDLQVFDDYRRALKSKSKHRDLKLSMALNQATDSLLEASKLLKHAIVVTEGSKAYSDPVVRSDVSAAYLVLDAIYKGILILAESNIADQKA